MAKIILSDNLMQVTGEKCEICGLLTNFIRRLYKDGIFDELDIELIFELVFRSDTEIEEYYEDLKSLKESLEKNE